MIEPFIKSLVEKKAKYPVNEIQIYISALYKGKKSRVTLRLLECVNLHRLIKNSDRKIKYFSDRQKCL